MALKTRLRLQKFLAQSGIASRRGAEKLIKAGRVQVDGEIVTEMGRQVDPENQIIRFDNEIVAPQQEKLVYILLNKPKGYVTTLSDPQGRPIVSELIKGVTTRVFPVGRLDLDTEGALLLTNDGELAHKIMHPRHQHTKTYNTLVKGIPTKEKIHELKRGIMLEGRKTAPAEIHLIKQKEQSSLFQVIIHEGRKRQIRLMFREIGHPVITLKRIAYGKLMLGSLKTGSYRFLSRNELKKLFL
jgi:pseudouridine synthase